MARVKSNIDNKAKANIDLSIDEPGAHSGRFAFSTITNAMGKAPGLLSSLRETVGVLTLQVVRYGRPATAVVTLLGWLVLGIGLIAWILGVILGWSELLLIACTALLTFLFCTFFIVGQASLAVDIELEPPRVTVGDPIAGRVIYSNATKRRMAPLELELRVGVGYARFRVPSLSPSARGDEIFIVSTERRGVIPIGPATAVKGDPLGLLVRKAPGGKRIELIVHPKTVSLPPFGAGLLRDLEGLTTKEVSPSDLAFHSLRDYEVGDDRRYIHWKSTARTGKLQVRQFLDTRRSSLTVLVDSRSSSYSGPEEFELALQVAGSLALRAARDELSVLLIAGEHAATSAVSYKLLDALARVELSVAAPEMSVLARQAVRRSSDTTIAIFVSGSLAGPSDVQRAGIHFPPEVRLLDIRVRLGNESGVSSAGRTTIVYVASLRDLPLIIARGDSL